MRLALRSMEPKPWSVKFNRIQCGKLDEFLLRTYENAIVNCLNPYFDIQIYVWYMGPNPCCPIIKIGCNGKTGFS